MTQESLYDCGHCGQTGTCASGGNGSSCTVCIKLHDLKPGKGDHKGLPCGVCNGIGKAPTMTDRLINRSDPVSKILGSYLGLITVGTLLLTVMMAGIFGSPRLGELITFAGPIIGIVLGYHFGPSRSRAA